MADSEPKLKETLDKVVKENTHQELFITCKQIEYIVVSKRDNIVYELHIGDVKIKQIEKLNYLCNYLSNRCNEKGDTFESVQVKQSVIFEKMDTL